MLDDDRLRQHARSGRRQSLPRWLFTLDQIKPTRAIIQTHILGDGDNVFLGVATPGRSFTIVIYIDHNMGTIVKDAFTVELPVDEVVARTAQLGGDDETIQDEILLEDAAAKIHDAIEHGALMIEPYETDSWPLCKPLVQWMVRLLPAGGQG